MARTEKKFGQVAKVPGGTTVTELVPVSANRRNILLNMTATAADSVTAFVSNGNITVSPVGSPTSVMSTTQSNFLTGSLTGAGIEYQSYNSNMYHAATMNVSKTRVIGTPDGPGNRTFFANVSSTGVISASGSPGLSGGSYDNTIYNNGYYSTFAPIATNPVVSWGTGTNEATMFFMGLPRQGIGYGSSYAQWFVVYGTSGNIQNNQKNYPYINSAQVSNYSYIYGALNIKHPINNLLLVGGCGPSYGNAPELEIGEVDATGTPVAYAYSNRTQTQLNQSANEGVWSMFPLDFNSSTSQFAISTPTTNTQSIRGVAIDNNANVVGATFPNWPVGANASAGFRIVNQATSGSTILERLLGGTIVYPPAPTGVDVPNIERPIKGLKFSPDGNKLAVFYNRQYAGSGDTNSVLVIYTKGAGNTWTHTWSSGAQLPRSISYADSFDWSADSSMICMAGDDDVVRMLSFGYPASAANNVVTSTGSSPTLNAGSIPSPVNHVNGVFTNSISSVSAHRQVINMPTSDNTNRFVIFKKQNQVYLSTPNNSGSPATGQAISMVTGQTTGSGTINNYVGTIAQEVALVVGGVTQISGIVLEPGEKVSIQATTGSRADVAAYGVEIS